MNVPRQYIELVGVHLKEMRNQIWFIMMVQLVLSMGLVLGYGYLIPDISRSAALYLTTGAATQSFVTVGLVMLPQFISEAKTLGRFEYFLTLPISREAYLLSLITVVAMMALPGVAFSVALGAWHYDLPLTVSPVIVPVALLTFFSLAGVGVVMAVLSPHPQVTNALTQLIIFYVVFFAPVIIPHSQLPSLLQHVSVVMPPTYAADAVRGALTDLPGTHLLRSMLVLSGFAVVSLTISATTIRRRG